MGDHWRSSRPGMDAMSGIGEPAARYVTGWIVSLALTIGTILVVWRYQM